MKLSWEALLKFHKNPPKVALGRSLEVQAKYDQRIKNGTTLINLERRLFGNLSQNTDINPSNKIYKFLPNDFPYNVEDYIHHYILWFNPKFTEEKTKSKYCNLDNLVDEILRIELLDKNFIYFRNLPTNSSVKNIIHYQVFLNTK